MEERGPASQLSAGGNGCESPVSWPDLHQVHRPPQLQSRGYVVDRLSMLTVAGQCRILASFLCSTRRFSSIAMRILCGSFWCQWFHAKGSKRPFRVRGPFGVPTTHPPSRPLSAAVTFSPQEPQGADHFERLLNFFARKW